MGMVAKLATIYMEYEGKVYELRKGSAGSNVCDLMEAERGCTGCRHEFCREFANLIFKSPIRHWRLIE